MLCHAAFFDFLNITEIFLFTAAFVICKLFVRVGQDHTRCVNGTWSFCGVIA